MDFSNTILLVYPSHLNPTSFLSRLIGREVDNDEVLVPWTIDNKYYNAKVTFQLVELDERGGLPQNIDVLVYLFTTIPRTFPAGLIRSLDEPKDIALAIKIRPDSTDTAGGVEETVQLSYNDDEEWRETFEEVGFEVVDETAQPEEDDERPVDPLESIRQTLMTHLWPSMVRKPLSNPRGQPNDSIPATREHEDENEIPSEEDMDPNRSSFPISFDSSKEQTVEPRQQFPGLAELKAQIELDDFDRYDRDGEFGYGNGTGPSRLDMLDEILGGPGMEEYARLDDWLDDDEVDMSREGFVSLDTDNHDDHDEHQNGEVEEKHQHDTFDDKARSVEMPSFDDDFDDFAAFQSGPSQPLPESGLSMDPTPLLLHLQSVRAELAGLGEEERRLRAGKEVARVMRDLGFDTPDATDFLGDDGELIE